MEYGPTVVMVSKPVAARTRSSVVALNRDCGWARRTRSCAAMFLLILFVAAAFLFARWGKIRVAHKAQRTTDEGGVTGVRRGHASRKSAATTSSVLFGIRGYLPPGNPLVSRKVPLIPLKMLFASAGGSCDRMERMRALKSAEAWS